MKIIEIAIKDLKIFMKDRQATLLIILMPIVLIVVLGFSLNSLFEKDSANINKAVITIIDEDKSGQSKEFQDFFKEKTVKKYIEVEKNDLPSAKKKIKNAELSALLVIPKGYGESFSGDQKSEIELYTDKGSPVEGSIVKSIVSKYIATNSVLLSAAEASEDIFKKYSLDSKMILQDLSKLIDSEEELVKNGSLTNDGKGLSAMQYYSAAMVSMYILFVGMVGSSLLAEEREEETLSRMLTTTVSETSIILGKVLGIFLLGLIDIFILILFTKIVYKVDWGSSLLGLILLSVFLSYAASGLSVLIATLFKSSKTIDMVNPAIILVMSFVGGNMFPLYEMSDLLRKVSLTLMNNWGLRGYLSLMINSSAQSISVTYLVLFVMGTVLLGLGIGRLRASLS